jgi:hypothetical protein
VDINNNKVNYTNTPPLTIESGERRVNWKGRWKASWYMSMESFYRNLFDNLVDECYGSEIEPDVLDYFNMIEFGDNKDSYVTESKLFETFNEKRHLITRLQNGKWWLEDFWVIQTDKTELLSVTKGKHSPMRKACYRNNIYPLDVRGLLKINEKVKEFISECNTISTNNNSITNSNSNSASNGGSLSTKHSEDEYNELINESNDFK